jgi:hypothetical protein
MSATKASGHLPLPDGQSAIVVAGTPLPNVERPALEEQPRSIRAQFGEEQAR